MRAPVNKLFWWVFGVHAVVIGGLLIAPLFHRRPKEIVHIVELVSEPAPVEQPVVKPKPVVEKPIVDVPMPTNKPKWKPAKVIRQDNNRTTTKPTPTAPVQKKITSGDIRQALGSAGTVGEVDAYDIMLSKRFYTVWQVPVGAAYGLSAVGSITVGSDGMVSNRQLAHSSGDSAFDQSVQRALNTINRLPPPPAERVNQTITITFEPQ